MGQKSQNQLSCQLINFVCKWHSKTCPESFVHILNLTFRAERRQSGKRSFLANCMLSIMWLNWVFGGALLSLPVCLCYVGEPLRTNGSPTMSYILF